MILLPDESHFPALADDRILIRAFLLENGPTETWLLRRRLNFGAMRLRRALANKDWFIKYRDTYQLTDEGLGLSAQALSPTISTQGDSQ